MRYPVAIEVGSEDQAYGVVVPDLPGCFSAGDSLDEALGNAEEAIVAWIDAMLDDGQPIPRPSSIDVLRMQHPEWAEWVWAVVQVDPARLDDKIERVNITLPRRVLALIDAAARQAGESRSGYIARLALSEP
jgi:predicted RNase H-like HicB family nuclease